MRSLSTTSPTFPLTAFANIRSNAAICSSKFRTYRSTSCHFLLQHKQVFRALLLGSFGDVERSGDHGLPVNDHDFVVGNSMPVVYVGLETCVGDKVGRGVLLLLNNPDANAAADGCRRS